MALNFPLSVWNRVGHGGAARWNKHEINGRRHSGTVASPAIEPASKPLSVVKARTRLKKAMENEQHRK
ncbi:MAG: hypothetical protein LBP86_09035 [Azoarcus sp.]|jgi:hypothetical protein|nr:hypothetical protein [Azoarcus sp.]